MAEEYLVLLHESRVCKRCHERTYWTLESMLWSDKGICLPHASGIFERHGVMSPAAAFRAIVRALGPVDEMPEASERPADATAEPVHVRLWWVVARAAQRLHGAVRVRYVGRCAGCHTAIRRYGPAGRPLCDPCAAPQPETISRGDRT